jgi:hypothetical protein
MCIGYFMLNPRQKTFLLYSITFFILVVFSVTSVSCWRWFFEGCIVDYFDFIKYRALQNLLKTILNNFQVFDFLFSFFLFLLLLVCLRFLLNLSSF